MKHRLILFALLILFVCMAKAQNLINGRYLPEPMIKPGSNPQATDMSSMRTSRAKAESPNWS